MKNANGVDSKQSDHYRRGDLARIHMLAADLGLDDETYREMLFNLTGKRSAGDLDARQRWVVIKHLDGQGKDGAAGSGRPARADHGRPPDFSDPDRGKMFRKIGALLAEAKRPWSYADSIAKRMFNVERLAWCKFEQVHAIIGALMNDARRHGRREG